MKLDDLEVFIMTDQPETCGSCGCRTEFVAIPKGRQLHVCPDCEEVYILEDE